MEKGWLRVVNRYIYEYIQLKNIFSKKIREEVKIYVLFCSLSVMTDRWHSSRQKCGECLIYICKCAKKVYRERERPGLRGHPCRFYAEGVCVQTR